ncbi:MAG: TolC family protein [Bacteroidota bacterium]
MKYSFTAILWAIITSVAWAQEPYTLNQTIERVLNENLNIRVSQQGKTLFDEQVREVRNNFLPTINFSGSHQYFFDIPTQVAPADAFATPGTEPAPNAPAYLPLAFGLPHQTNLTVQLQQVLYNPQLPIGIKAAQTGRDMADLQLRQTKEQTVQYVSSAYYNAQSLAQQIKSLKQNQASLDRLIEITKLLRQNDLAKGTDVERLQLNQASLANRVANLEVAYEQLLNTLKLLTHTPMEKPFAIDTAINRSEVTMLTVADSMGRTDIALAHKQLEVQKLEERQIVSGYLPSLYATGVYGQTGFGELDQDYYEMFPISYVGVQMNLPIFDGLQKRSKRIQNRIQQSQTETQIEFLEQQVETEIANAYASLSTQQQAVQVQQQALALAEKVFQNIQLQYREGVAGVSDVINSENELRQAQIDYFTAWTQLRLAELDMRQATGNLLANR